MANFNCMIVASLGLFCVLLLNALTTGAESETSPSDSSDLLQDYHKFQKAKRLEEAKVAKHALKHYLSKADNVLHKLLKIQPYNQTLKEATASVLKQAGLSSVRIDKKMITIEEALKRENVSLLEPLYIVMLNSLELLGIGNSTVACPACRKHYPSYEVPGGCLCCPICRDCVDMDCPTAKACPTCKPKTKDESSDLTTTTSTKPKAGESRSAIKKRKHKERKLRKARRKNLMEMEMYLQQMSKEQRLMVESKIKLTEIIVNANKIFNLHDEYAAKGELKADLKRLRYAQDLYSRLSQICGQRNSNHFAEVIESGGYLTAIVKITAERVHQAQAKCKLCSTDCIDDCYKHCRKVVCERCKCRPAEHCGSSTTTTCRPCN